MTQKPPFRIADAARELGLAYHATHQLLLKGELEGQRTASGRWLVARASVTAYQHRQAAPPIDAPQLSAKA